MNKEVRRHRSRWHLPRIVRSVRRILSRVALCRDSFERSTIRGRFGASRDGLRLAMYFELSYYPPNKALEPMRGGAVSSASRLDVSCGVMAQLRMLGHYDMTAFFKHFQHIVHAFHAWRKVLVELSAFFGDVADEAIVERPAFAFIDKVWFRDWFDRFRLFVCFHICRLVCPDYQPWPIKSPEPMTVGAASCSLRFCGCFMRQVRLASAFMLEPACVSANKRIAQHRQYLCGMVLSGSRHSGLSYPSFQSS